MAKTRVCEIISDSDPYLFAWIGEVDADTQEISPKHRPASKKAISMILLSRQMIPRQGMVPVARPSENDVSPSPRISARISSSKNGGRRPLRVTIRLWLPSLWNIRNASTAS
ncbi:MAG: hypothetical protein J07HN6_02897 [Halonotius sp. J07HN6]|nr:MAG: hypothetical protein J07HN6_02897 [Halonotius sp. J07HN6]